ncbi:DUF5753 domain-containing protein [Sinosporangium siamense]|uniref:DUF5753 domain-containing protein n=1 Tax=Sinosporangium siamense TaxID=1367973 RepID=UPI0035EF09C3
MPEWFRPWVEIEQDAMVLRTWQPLVVYGLLQTEAYAKALMSGEPGVTDHQLNQNVSARLERQQVLRRTPPVVVWVVLDEGVLTRCVGDPNVMAGQLQHLIEVARQPHITLQVLPNASRVTTGLNGGFVIAEGQGAAMVGAWRESSGEGQLVDRAKGIRDLSYMYEVIRAEALAQRASLRVIEEMRGRWLADQS